MFDVQHASQRILGMVVQPFQISQRLFSHKRGHNNRKDEYACSHLLREAVVVSGHDKNFGTLGH